MSIRSQNPQSTWQTPWPPLATCMSNLWQVKHSLMMTYGLHSFKAWSAKMFAFLKFGSQFELRMEGREEWVRFGVKGATVHCVAEVSSTENTELEQATPEQPGLFIYVRKYHWTNKTLHGNTRRWKEEEAKSLFCIPFPMGNTFTSSSHSDTVIWLIGP